MSNVIAVDSRPEGGQEMLNQGGGSLRADAVARRSSPVPTEEDGDELRRRKMKSHSPSRATLGLTSRLSSSQPIFVSSTSLEHVDKVVKDPPTTSCALCPVGTWCVVPHNSLPNWLQDNDYLVKGHRPPLQSTVACLRSIFRIHTETVNIWTHLLGALLFLYFAIFYFVRGDYGHVTENGATLANSTGSEVVPIGDKMVFLVFFSASITCMTLSWLFHTMCCHSSEMSLFCVKLDYCGIAILIVGSFVPWLYFGFYCSFLTKFLYVSAVVILGLATVTICMWDRFSVPHWRPLRAGLFLSLGLSGIVPAAHYSLLEGVVRAVTAGGVGWLLLMGAVFILGACLYAFRIPERFFPGKCDIIFHSHQIFHVCVVLGCYVEYRGICQLEEYIRSRGVCS